MYILTVLLSFGWAMLMQTQSADRCLAVLEPYTASRTPPADYIDLRSLDLSPDRQVLAIASPDALTLYETATWAHETVDLSPYHAQYVIAWSPDGTALAVYAGPRDGILIFDTANWQVEQRLPTDDNPIETALAMAWSPDSSRLAVVGSIPWRVWHIEAAAILYEITPDYPDLLVPEVYPPQSMIAWSPDGVFLAVPNDDDVIIIDSETGTPATTLPADLHRPTSLIWSGTGELLITDSLFILDVWQPDFEQQLQQVQLNASGVMQLSPDEQMLAVVGGNTISVVTVSDFEVIAEIVSEDLPGPISNVYWLDDVRVLIVGRYSIVEVWNIETGLLEQEWRITCQ
jgi:WD40 repeat protein